MTVGFEKSFAKSLKKISDKKLLTKIEKVILDCENAETLQDISGIKKLVGFSNFYRIRIGDYRIGIELLGETLNFIIVSHRKDMYEKFP